MNADVLLNATEVSNNGYEGIFYYNGEFKNILGSRKSTINANLGLAEGIIKGENKKTVKMECVLDNIGPDKSFNNLVIIGMRVMCYVPNSFGSADADDKISIKLFNRTIKLKGNRKRYEIGFCDAEIIYLNSVLKNKLTVEFVTKDPSQYPIHIFGVDVFTKSKETIEFQEKYNKIKSIFEAESEKDREKGINNVVLEMMQSENVPLLVNWKEKFKSVQNLLSDVTDKEVRDEKRLLFNISEASTYVTEFMTDPQIENDLMYFIHPLIGQYICQVEELDNKDSTYSRLILESLMRLLKKCLEKLNKGDKVEPSQLRYSQYNCFINYVKEMLDSHRWKVNNGAPNLLEISSSQVCAFIKVACNMAHEDQKIFFYFLENSYPAMITDLQRLARFSVLKEIEMSTSLNKIIDSSEEKRYNSMIDNCLYLIYHFHSYVSNSYNQQEGSAVENPHTEFVLSLLHPFIYSSSDYVKKRVASKIKKLSTGNLVDQISQRRKDKNAQSDKESDLNPLKHLNRQLYTIGLNTVMKQACKDNYLLESQKEDVEMQEEEGKQDEEELKRAIEMSLEDNKQSDNKPDAVMAPQHSNSEIQIFDFTIDLIRYFKGEIIKNANKDSILEADIAVYLLCRTIKVYGKYRSSLNSDHFDTVICDNLIEIVENAITTTESNDLLEKTKRCETTYILIETLNSLISFSDKQPLNLVRRDKKEKKAKEDKNNSKDPPKARMRTQIIFKLIERMKERQTSNEDEPKLVLWLNEMIQKFVEYFTNDRGSITISKALDKTITCEDNESDNHLLKVQNKEHLWRWNNILKSLSLASNKYFDVQVFNSCLSLLSNMLHFERLHYNWLIHQKEKSVKKNNDEGEVEDKKTTRDRSKMSSSIEREKEFMKTISNADLSELNSKTKSNLKEIIPNAVFHLRIEKLQKNFLTILELLCENDKEFLKLQHISVYKYYFKMVEEIFVESNEFKRNISYEKLFLLINLLKTIWSKYTQREPSLWKKYAIDHPETLKMLFKISFKTVEQAACPCLCLLASAFEISSPTLLENITNSSCQNVKLSEDSVTNLAADHKGRHKQKKHKKDRHQRSREQSSPEKSVSEDVKMDDEETKQKVKDLVVLFTGPIRNFIEIFVVGKRSKNLRNASTHFVKGLWECAQQIESEEDNSNDKNSVKIFNTILSVPMQSSSASLISYILKQKAEKSRTEGEANSPNSDLKLEDVFQFIKKSLLRANDLIFSHENMELYSNIYNQICNRKTTINPFGGSNNSKEIGSMQTSQPNIFIYEREPCTLCTHFMSMKSSAENSALDSHLDRHSANDEYVQQTMNDVKSDSKYNEQSLVYKLSTPMKIKEVLMNTYELKGTRNVNEVSIYMNNSQKDELSAIKRDKSVWTFITTMKVTEGKGEKKCKFSVPITACNLMFEFHVVNSNKTTTSSGNSKNPYSDPFNSNYESFKYNSYLGRSAQPHQTFSVDNKEVLNCPRCHIIVEDSHGVCNNCRENAFQCTYCRNINYENLEGFLCNECGLSRYGKYDFSIIAKPDFAIEKVNSEKIREDLENTLSQVQSRYVTFRRKLKSLFGNYGSGNQSNDMLNVFNESLVQYKSIMKSLEFAKNLRKELLEMEEQARGENKYENDNENSDDIFNDESHMEVDSNAYGQDSQEFSG